MLIFELQIVHGNQIAVLNTHFLQTSEETTLTQHLVEPHTAFVVAEVGVGDETLQPGSLDDPSVVVAVDVDLAAGMSTMVGMPLPVCSEKPSIMDSLNRDSLTGILLPS